MMGSIARRGPVGEADESYGWKQKKSPGPSSNDGHATQRHPCRLGLSRSNIASSTRTRNSHVSRVLVSSVRLAVLRLRMSSGTEDDGCGEHEQRGIQIVTVNHHFLDLEPGPLEQHVVRTWLDSRLAPVATWALFLGPRLAGKEMDAEIRMKPWAG
jgi:hypothetical protein